MDIYDKEIYDTGMEINGERKTFSTNNARKIEQLD